VGDAVDHTEAEHAALARLASGVTLARGRPGAAVVHARRVTEELRSSAFWLNAITGIRLTLLVSALALPISLINWEPNLVGLIISVSLNFTFSLGAVQLALLERSALFRMPRGRYPYPIGRAAGAQRSGWDA
jgi:Polysaccharide biosynthesis protein